jgi:hypothetical protein
VAFIKITIFYFKKSCCSTYNSCLLNSQILSQNSAMETSMGLPNCLDHSPLKYTSCVHQILETFS